MVFPSLVVPGILCFAVARSTSDENVTIAGIYFPSKNAERLTQWRHDNTLEN